MTKFEKGMICGLFLSKFNNLGYKALGFTNWTEFYNSVGFAIDVKPISIRNYRDEFDPYFENERQGYKRKITKSREPILEKYKDLELDVFNNSELCDMTQKGCEFDFKVTTKDNFYAIRGRYY